MSITITESASLQIKEMMKDEDQANVYLRFGVKGGGCSGLSYAMGFDYDIQDNDTTFEESGIPIVIKKEDKQIVEGTVIDFKQNMMGGGFTIENPNAIASCGCGSSFRTATNAGTPDEDC